MKKLIVIFLLAFPFSMKSEEPFWQRLWGINTGEVTSISVNPINDDIYLTSTEGVYRSDNNGFDWKFLSHGVSSYITISSNGTLVLTKFENYHNIHYLSTDDGNNWLKINNRYDDVCIGFDSANTVYFVDFKKKDSLTIYKSSNMGKTWDSTVFAHKIDKKLIPWHYKVDANGNISIGCSLEIYDDSNAGVLFLINKDSKILKILDSIPAVQCYYLINDNEIIIGTTNGLYHTTDGGTSWQLTFKYLWITNLYQLAENQIIMSAIDLYNQSSDDGGIYFSSNIGKSWNKQSDIQLNRKTLKTSTDCSVYYGGNGFGFYSSTDNGINWKQSNTGFSAPIIYNIAFNNVGDVYCGNPGLNKSTDNGLTWISIGLEGKYIDQIIIDDKGYIFANNDGHLLRSKDDGKTWEDLSKLIGWTIWSDDGFIFNKRNHLFVGPYRTTDNGDTWTNEYNYLGGYYSYAMNSEGHIFRGGSGNEGETICRSTDDGDTWEVVWGDPKEWPNGVVCSEVHDMIFSKTDSVGYACGYKTTNNGRSWYINRSFEEPSFCTITIDSLGYIYSFNNAYSHFAYYKLLYKRIKDSTWVEVDTSGLNGVDEFNTMATSPNGYLYLAAHNGGLYRSRQAYVSAPDTPPAEHSGIAIFPNPASDYIEINLERWSPSSVWTPSEIKIYNSLGQCVLSPAGGGGCEADGGGNPLAFGEGPGVRLDISHLPIGLYFISSNNGKRALTGSFIILR